MKSATLRINSCTGRCELTVRGSLYQGRIVKQVAEAFKAMGVPCPPKALWNLSSEWLTPTKMKDVYVVPFVTDLPHRKLHEGLDALP